MDPRDEQRALILQSDISFGVVGNAETGEFLLVDLRNPLSQEEDRKIEAGRFRFCGLCGFRDGQATARCEPDLDAIGLMCLASYEFALRVAEFLKGKEQGGTEWLKNLWSLPDTREN